MRLQSTMVAACAAAMLGAGAAQAAPTGAMVQPAIDTGAAPAVELVRGGCGFGEHRSWYGRCHYNRGWRGAVRYRHNHWRWRHWY